MILDSTVNTLAQKIFDEGPNALSFEEACALTKLPAQSTPDLFLAACKIRQHYQNDNIVRCSILNAKSGACAENCAFCSQSAHHRTDVVKRPLLSAEDMVSEGLRMDSAGATRFSMVTSGTKLNEAEIETVAQAASTLTKSTPLTVCASLGQLTASSAERLKTGGVTFYHHNLETARSYFPQICTTHDYEEDIETLRIARKAGLRLCCGGIFGLGESWEQRVEMAFTLRELDVDGIPINFLNPLPGTRMENQPLLSPMEALRVVALYRFIHPARPLLICGGREITLRDFQSWVFLAGASGMIVGNYLTTQGRDIGMDQDMIATVQEFS
ncbi:biotin synthase [Syntrophus gentianae]|uniref:Biotin synthase n=1 Tax=Syntrophus gentianae TaxID=43775 RepID=A0A1H7Y1I2_9BACT|nr:biotin synthase BioB [Syntrophus gentianae]SEM39049.1 biotin synthase [Syntrophus gentianae]